MSSRHIVAVCLLAAAVALGLNDKAGWGWCLFFVFLCL